jgi:hypothetical protein
VVHFPRLVGAAHHGRDDARRAHAPRWEPPHPVTAAALAVAASMAATARLPQSARFSLGDVRR